MSVELRARIGDVLEALDGLDIDDIAQAVIDELGLHANDKSVNNSMVQYETKWFHRDNNA